MVGKKRKLPRAGADPLMSIQYSERLSDWKLWENKANELLEAANLLEPHVREYWNIVTTDFNEGRYSDPLKTPRTPPSNPQSAYFILVTYAFENLLKAIIIRHCQNELRNRLLRKLPDVFKTHNLRALFKEANIPVTDSEEDLLHRLYLQSTWAGRYPVPVEASALKNMETYSDGKSYLTACFYAGDADHLTDLLKRVKTLIQDEPNTADDAASV
jgi:hypothetical protein